MNFQIELDNLIKEISKKDSLPTLCLHSCCAPCSSYVISYLMEYFDITVFYYNPNIYPETEYMKRLDEQIRLVDVFNRQETVQYELNGRPVIRKKRANIKLVTEPYDHASFLAAASGLEREPEGGRRCEACFRMRLSETFHYAREHGFDYFGTTLSVSPHKNAVLLNSIGESFDLPPAFLVSDFKKREGYKVSILLSAQLDLYRQNYCGCEFSLHPDIRSYV